MIQARCPGCGLPVGKVGTTCSTTCEDFMQDMFGQSDEPDPDFDYDNQGAEDEEDFFWPDQFYEDDEIHGTVVQL